VGLFEDFGEVLQKLAQETGSQRINEHHLNSAGGEYKFELSDSDIALLSELNAWDIRLYHWAKSTLRPKYRRVSQ
jgi:hypothetical protein